MSREEDRCSGRLSLKMVTHLCSGLEDQGNWDLHEMIEVGERIVE